ncbi:DNA polymerase III subunit beta [Nocardiopsis sp. FR4]|uniref:DNA polymerase III subunit beta n=1 Tax=Nocardiopsis sp. FR4 TaxID=2605985 RepID=UPI00135986D7|nr:DNA polymerase III subunit beta [Nocardiopsis sp. FR4]
MTTVLERTHEVDSTRATTGAFTTTRATLVDALATVGVAVAARPSVPVLAGALLESDGTDLLVRGFDYEAAVTVRVPDAVDVPGRVLVSHHELSKLLNAMTKGMRKRDADGLPVTVRVRDGHFATVEVADSAMPMELFPVEDYPDLPESPPVFAHVDGDRFVAETRRVLRAVGRDDTLPMLTGMKVDVRDYGLTLAATDRYRLAVGHVRADVVTDTAPDSGVLIDGALLGKTLPKLGSDIRLGYGPGPFGDLVSLQSGPVSVVARLHNDGEFIDYASILPTERVGTVVVDRTELVTQTERAAAVLAAKGHKHNPVTVTVAADALRVSPYLGEGAQHVRTRTLAARTSGIGDLTFGLDHRFFTEALESFTGESLTLHLQGPEKPCVLTDAPDGLNDPTAFRHLLMPRRLTS